MITLKHRTPLNQCELKFEASEGDAQFSGYASVFGGTDSDNDTILPGAFKETLADGGISRVKMFINHDQRAIPVGGFAEAKEDKKGLFVKGDINLNHKDGPSLYSALKQGHMDAMSIGFIMSKKDWTPKEGFEDDPVATMWGNRNIKSLSLREISVVNYPADDNARVNDVKSIISEFTELKDFERFLCAKLGLSNKAATAFVAQLKRIVIGDRDDSVEAKRESIATATALLKELNGKIRR